MSRWGTPSCSCLRGAREAASVNHRNFKRCGLVKKRVLCSRQFVTGILVPANVSVSTSQFRFLLI